MEPSDLVAVVGEVARALDAQGAGYLVGGSLASSLHGIPRSTQDADLVADLRVEHVASFVKRLEGSFYVDEERVLDAVRRRASFNVIHLATMFKVDVFVSRDDPASRAEMSRRQEYRVGESDEETLFVASAEDTVAQKLYWYRLGRGVSERQWQDLLGVLKVQGDRLDAEVLRQGSKSLGVEDLLDRALAEAELS